MRASRGRRGHPAPRGGYALNLRLRAITEVALAAALLSALAPFSIPLGPIPLSIASLLVYLIGALLSPLCAAATVLLYLSLGALGLPVFSGFGGGVGVLVGPSGGFLVGYLPCAVLTSLLSKGRGWLGRRGLLLGMLLGATTLYLFGALWLAHASSLSVRHTALAVLPLLPLEAGKLLLALLFLPRLRRALVRMK